MTSQKNDFFSVTPLGAGKEVGRSCFLCKFQRAGIKSAFLLDCGINPSISEDNALSDLPALPFFDLIDEPLDFVLITHFHNDHVSGLPFLVNSYKDHMKQIPSIYMTKETQDVMFLNLRDQTASNKLFHHIPQSQRKQVAELALDLLKKAIKTLSFNEFIKLKNNVNLTIYPAGHVVGAAMFLLEIAGFQVLYTGDWSIEKDYSLKQAELPFNLQPDLLITEGTYGTLMHTERAEREKKFIKACVDTLLKDGRVLLPVFAVGRVQELLKILDNYWKTHPDVQKYDIYYISSIGKNFSCDEQFVRHEKDSLMITRNVPCIIFATPGMLQQGVSRQLFEELCNYEKNLLLITGYGADGSYLHSLLQRQKADKNILIKKRDGTQQQLRMRILEISFSAHSDLLATMTLIETIRPRSLCLIHGSHGALEKLEAKLKDLYNNGIRKFQYKADFPAENVDFFDYLVNMKIYVPDNGETLAFPIEGNISAQYSGKLQFDYFVQNALYTGVEQSGKARVFLKAKSKQPKSQDFYLKQSGIEFALVDRPNPPTTIFRSTLGCDLQIKLKMLYKKLCALFNSSFVSQKPGQFDVCCGLFDSIVRADDSQFDILRLILANRQNQTEETRNQLQNAQGSQLKVMLYRNANSRQLTVEDDEDGYYCELSCSQEDAQLQRFLLDKLVGKGTETQRIRAPEFAKFFAGCEVESAENGIILINGAAARQLETFWYLEAPEQCDPWVLGMVKDINLLSLIDCAYY